MLSNMEIYTTFDCYMVCSLKKRKFRDELLFKKGRPVVDFEKVTGRHIAERGRTMTFGKWCAGALASLALFAGASTADAYVIDFTDAGTGSTGTLFGGSVSWTMTASGILNNSQSFDGSSAPSGTGLSFQTDGYGVGAHDDEITNYANNKMEWIKVKFSAPVLVNAIMFLDLFQTPDGSSQEVGQAAFNGGSPIISLYASDIAGTGAPGFVGASFAAISVTEIFFTVLSSNDQYGFADGALAGIGIAPVPVPAAGLMLLGGLGGLAALRRRRKKAA